MTVNPYIRCPIIENENFRLRLVKHSDAHDLMTCYSDKSAVAIFNSDNCPIDFYFDSEDELRQLIKFWLMEYNEGGYVRFAIVDKSKDKAIGTIEIFVKKETYETYGRVGLLRVDLASDFELEDSLNSIFTLTDKHFKSIFTLDSLMTKAVPLATNRVNVLKANGYVSVEGNHLTQFYHYYIKQVI